MTDREAFGCQRAMRPWASAGTSSTNSPGRRPKSGGGGKGAAAVASSGLDAFRCSRCVESGRTAADRHRAMSIARSNLYSCSSERRSLASAIACAKLTAGRRQSNVVSKTISSCAAIAFLNSVGSRSTALRNAMSRSQTPAKACPVTKTRIGRSPVASSAPASRSEVSRQVARPSPTIRPGFTHFLPLPLKGLRRLGIAEVKRCR